MSMPGTKNIVLGLVLAALGITAIALLLHRSSPFVSVEPLTSPQKITAQRLNSLRPFCKSYRLRRGLWPGGPSDLLNMFSEITPTMLTDGWGQGFAFHTNSSGIMIVSLGADGQPGGTRTNADVMLTLE